MTIRRDFATCRSCGAPITWTITGLGKRMPIDSAPSDHGNLFVFIPDDPRAPLEVESCTDRSPRADAARAEDRPRFLSHFATCPNAAQHRGPR